MEDLKDYSEDSIPVLDNDNRLIGVITSANIVDSSMMRWERTMRNWLV